jgi:hypothetical protein
MRIEQRELRARWANQYQECEWMIAEEDQSTVISDEL